MGVGVGLAGVREQQWRHSQQGRLYQKAGGSGRDTESGKGATEAGSGGVRAPYSTVGDDLVHVLSGKRKHTMSNDYLPLIRTTEQGERMLIAAVISTAVWDALGQGMTGQNREGLIESAWQYLESSMFRQDLELVGFFVDVDVFLRELRELAGNGE